MNEAWRADDFEAYVWAAWKRRGAVLESRPLKTPSGKALMYELRGRGSLNSHDQ